MTSPNAGVLGKIYYNIGYCNFLDWYQSSFTNEWGYLELVRNKVDEDFMYTSAHELGHSILKAYVNTWHSFTHDDLSKIWQTPNGKKSYPIEKASGEIKSNQPIIKIRTKAFGDLEKLALDGLNYHWGRNKNHAEAKDVKINQESYEVFMTAINIEENAMDDISLVFNTNGDWMRSGNPGTATLNPISWVGNLVSREAICYNVGYIYEYFYKNTWGYQAEIDKNKEFEFTAAHEIGHEILKSYGGTVYSYGHKGSVNVLSQSMKKNSPVYPSTGEIDIMPYYPSSPPPSMYNRYVASEKDVLGLIWLTKIKIN